MSAAKSASAAFGIAVHGGAGTVTRASLSPEREQEFRAALTQALKAGDSILRAGGSSLDAVSAAVVVLEDSPLFNAGRGAVLNADGEIELDAAIMDGNMLRAGAVAAMRTGKNPILVARAVMERSEHVMLAAAGADAFARAQGLPVMPPEYFITQHRRDDLARERERIRMNLPADATSEEQIHGTVGAVALDQNGDLAAATSTGGRTNKMAGRVGDTPIIGAGTYAANDTCAVSATGHGEYFTRMVVAYDIAARMRYRNESLESAAGDILMNKLAKIGGGGGVICIDRRGNFSLPFNTEGMYRGSVGQDGHFKVAVFRE
jgi:beta-aspartyl-peptidase (threonine type)